MSHDDEEGELITNLTNQNKAEQNSSNLQPFKRNLSLLVFIIMFSSVLFAYYAYTRPSILTKQIQKDELGINPQNFTSMDAEKNNSVPKLKPIETMQDILPNPFNDDSHALITQEQIKLAKALREMHTHSARLFQELSAQEKQHYSAKYKLDQHPELRFCVVVPTFNNKMKMRHTRNIRSILTQDYANFHILIIDDASADGTSTELEDFLKRENKRGLDYKLIINKQRRYALANVRTAALKHCSQEEIMMVVDGDDELIGRQVLKLFNAVFQEKGVWLAYSNSLSSDLKVGYSRPYHPSIIQHNAYRSYDFTVSHLRAYYVWLFLMVREEDLQDEHGEYLRAAGDMAACVPMLEMAHQRVAYLPELTYYYNMRTGLNVHKDRLAEQRHNNINIRNRKPYQALSVP